VTEAVRLGSRLIEAVGGIVIALAMLRAVTAGARLRLSDEGAESMRRIMAGGVVTALSLMTAATLLRTITLRSWSAIGMFAAILALRTLVKRTLSAEASG